VCVCAAWPPANAHEIEGLRHTPIPAARSAPTYTAATNEDCMAMVLSDSVNEMMSHRGVADKTTLTPALSVHLASLRLLDLLYPQ